jgi:hypothetical protein
VTKNNLLKLKASVFLEEMFNKYGINSRTIIYVDLSPLFKNTPGFIIKKFELDKKLSKEELDRFKKSCGIKTSAPPPKPIPSPIRVIPEGSDKPKTIYPINKPKVTEKTK